MGQAYVVLVVLERYAWVDIMNYLQQVVGDRQRIRRASGLPVAAISWLLLLLLLDPERDPAEDGAEDQGDSIAQLDRVHLNGG